MFVCWTVKMTQPSKDVARSSVTHCHGSFYIVLWDLTVSPHRSGVPRTQGTDPLPSLKKKETLTWHPVNQSPATDELSFIRKVQSNVCDVSKNQYLVSDVCTAEPRVHFPQRSVFAVFSCCSSSNATPWFFYKSYKMQRCWPFEWDSQIFFYMVVFVWRKKRSLFYTQIWCKKEKKFN